ncbi:uncharacterized protein LOC115216566 [Octopus sinensis]|uniref:Uncharacterized protein LOC115216566 n=1 Tax=Octopus sinensis TaxID=2607531 RepID=A0A6P7SUE5_9MOLL|nr:uncharacterized protein LOC115216566 [Octopus sinensis]
MSAKLLLLLCIGARVTIFVATEACFVMNGEDSWLYFNSTVKGGDVAHYKLKFASKKDNGLIFYAQGENRDFEALFLNRGKLTYFLFNPTDYGTGSTYGVYIECTKKISKNYEHDVEFYRNEEFKTDEGITYYKSGIKLDGVEFKKIGYSEGVDIEPQFFLGGTKENITTEVPKFKGIIKNFIEETTGQIFEKATFEQDIQACEKS